MKPTQKQIERACFKLGIHPTIAEGMTIQQTFIQLSVLYTAMLELYVKLKGEEDE